MPSRASPGGQTEVLQPRGAETIGETGDVGNMATIAPLARVRCPCARGERPREGLAAAVAVEKGVPPTFSVDGTSATVGGLSFVPGSHSSHE